ncbi:otoancorin, partial [Elysia marginata]
MDRATVHQLGKLVRGMSSAHLERIRPEVAETLLDYFDDLDLNDVQKRAIVAKARHTAGGLPIKFLELDDFAEAMSLDDLEDIGESGLHAHLNVSSRVRWGLPQSAYLAHMYKLSNGARRLRASDLNALGHVAAGLLPSDLDAMTQMQDDVYDLAEELKDIQDDLTSGQIDLLVSKFHDFSDLDNKEVVIDATRAMQSAHILAFLKEEHFEKLDFTKEGKTVFVSQVAKMKTDQMPRTHLQFLSRTLLDMIEDTISKASEESSSDDRQAKRLRSLGNMALGLTPSQIRGFTGNAILDNADLLRSLPFSKAQSKALLENVDKSIPNWKCRADMLARLGTLLQHVESPFNDDCDDEIRSSMSAIAKGLERRRKMVEERLEAGMSREFSDVTDDAGEKRVINSMLTAAIAVQQPGPSTNAVGRRRKKRGATTTDGPLTCDALMHLQKTANLVEMQHLGSMKVEEFSNCFATLGSIDRWPDETLSVLVNKAKSVYGNVDTWSNELCRRAGSLVAGLSPAEIQQLQLTGVDAMHSIGKHGRLTVEQLKAGFRRWQSLSGNTDVSKISSADFSSLAEFACGLELTDINKLDATTFKRSLGVIGSTKACSPEQRKAYAMKALSIYGSKIASWSPALVGEMGHLLGALSTDHLKKLTGEHLAFVSPTVIQNFQTEGLK